MTIQKQSLREILFQIELLKRRKVQRFLLDIGLTPGQGQARILVYLSSHSSVTQKEIADRCMLDVTTMSRVLNKLEEMGLISRQRDPGCRRAYQIGLTEAGRQKAEEVNRGFERLEEMLCRELSEEEIGSLTTGLKKVKESLETDERM
ncbi:MAG TPA: MarR family transcriptional regulator [Candidatus Mediterraneibacter faecigallinarum]|jgi:DNA-binding MarR family transcriptional regulator|uniref:MarR family transcriptional regulator n=1 Tax=Candidatus Mediterraneibacter faecigallinarum TaxID=2838669 RepID=A0A9D2NVZ4_9FIRM|nr:MarR family transcriptional regulator [Candidatus Mediterraneibacter faecigallinarum]